MRQVIHFNTAVNGGAFEAAYKIYNLLKSDDKWQLKFFAADTSSKYPDIIKISQPNSFVFRQIFKKHYNFIKRINANPKTELFSLPSHPFKFKLDKENISAIHLHWVDEWFDFKAFFNSIEDNIPIIWTLHDMSPFTGGCHSTLTCDKFLRQCKKCPQLDKTFNDLKISEKNFLSKKKLFHNKNFHIVASSEDMYQRAKSSAIFPPHTKFYKIPLGIDTLAQKVINKKIAKSVLQIPEDCFVIGLGASDLTRPNKGLHLLTDAIRHLDNVFLLTLGYPNDLNLKINHPHLHVGYTKSDQIKSLLYSAMDVLTVPTIFEPFGLVILEAMLHKVPVIASRVGGPSEMIEDNVNGLLFENNNSIDLAKALKRLQSCEEKEKGRLVEQAIFRIEKNFSLSNLQHNYLRLYNEVLL